MRHLPIGLQSFETIIKNNCVYIDKTGLLYELIKTPGRYFLSRPRRFGKSLTCATLEAIFKGRKELFQGLAISNVDYIWPTHPVVYFDFNDIAHATPNELNQALSEELDAVAAKYGLALSSTLLQTKFKQLIIALAEKYGPVVVIIDEYDKPILDNIDNIDMAIAMRKTLKTFYGTLKGKDIDSKLRFLFVTGVSKFSKVSIFSELNNLDDITMSEKYATLCGCTQQELETVFSEYIQALAVKEDILVPAMLDKLKFWYNGFQFSKLGPKIYNTFSLLHCFSKQDFSNYWFTSGTPSFLIRLIEKNPLVLDKLSELESSKLSTTSMDSFSIETYNENFTTMLVQAGYLTITDYDKEGRTYSLMYPNYENRLSMTEQIFKHVAHLSFETFGPLVGKFHKALNNDDMQAFCQAMQDLFILLPHQIVIHQEKFYHGIFHAITRLVGAEVYSEVPTQSGFSDVVIQNKKHVYVIELKRDKTPDFALKQIADKAYFSKFKVEGNKPVTLVGMCFNKSNKGVVLKWKIVGLDKLGQARATESKPKKRVSKPKVKSKKR